VRKRNNSYVHQAGKDRSLGIVAICLRGRARKGSSKNFICLRSQRQSGLKESRVGTFGAQKKEDIHGPIRKGG